MRRTTTVGGGDIDQFRVEFTPNSQDQRFGVFQLYVRGAALGDATTTALCPHVHDLQRLSDAAEVPGIQGPQPLDLGDTFDHLTVTVATTDQDMIFTVTWRPGHGCPPPWAPRTVRRTLLLVRRTEIIKAWRQAEPQFRRLLTSV